MSTSTESSQHSFGVAGEGKANLGKGGIVGGELGGSASYGYTKSSTEVISYYSNINDRAKLTAYIGEQTLQLGKILLDLCLKHRGGKPYQSKAESDNVKFQEIIASTLKAAYESEIQGMINVLKPILKRN